MIRRAKSSGYRPSLAVLSHPLFLKVAQDFVRTLSGIQMEDLRRSRAFCAGCISPLTSELSEVPQLI